MCFTARGRLEAQEEADLNTLSWFTLILSVPDGSYSLLGRPFDPCIRHRLGSHHVPRRT